MAIVIVRHGETDLNVARVVQPKDTPLGSAGIRQAAALAKRLAQHSVDTIVCSDLKRAKMTAAPLAKALGMKPEYSELLRERDLGIWCGTPYDRIPGDLFAADYLPPKGEGWGAFYERVERAFAWVTELARGRGGDVVVVTHGLVCVRMLAHHATRQPDTSLPTNWHNTGVSIIDAYPPHTVRVLNCVQHLSDLDGPRGVSGY